MLCLPEFNCVGPSFHRGATVESDVCLRIVLLIDVRHAMRGDTHFSGFALCDYDLFHSEFLQVRDIRIYRIMLISNKLK